MSRLSTPQTNNFSEWSVNGNASFEAGATLLTPATNSTAGSVWWMPNTLRLNGYTFSFTTSISGGTGADGMCMMFVDPAYTTPPTTGGGGGGCGFDGLIGAAHKFIEYSSPRQLWTYKLNGGSVTDQFNVSDASISGTHTWSLNFLRTAAGTFTITRTKDAVGIATWTGALCPDVAWVGFGAGCGGLNNNHRVQAFSSVSVYDSVSY